MVVRVTGLKGSRCDGAHPAEVMKKESFIAVETRTRDRARTLALEYAFGEPGPVTVNDWQVLRMKIRPPAA